MNKAAPTTRDDLSMDRKYASYRTKSDYGGYETDATTSYRNDVKNFIENKLFFLNFLTDN